MGVRGSLALVALAAASPGEAHVADYAAPAPDWTWDAWVTAPLILSLVLFLIGWRRLHRRSTTGAALLTRRGALFLCGWLLLAGAVVSPLHQLGERSFAAHMFEHELLMLAAAPLLVLSRPLGPMLWAFPSGGRRLLGAFSALAAVRTAWSALTGPVTATIVQAAALWLWHVPSLFDRALAAEGWHAAQHLSFLVSSFLFWTAMIARTTAKGTAAMCLFATSLVAGALGALMAFAASPWYPRYEAMGLAPFGLSPVEDQQLAGLLMWVPGGMVHAAAALAIIHMLLRDEREVRLA